MTNWQSLVVQLADYLAFTKLHYFMTGVYIWESVLNLHFDYSVVMRKRPFLWTQLLYMGCRWCTLFTIIVVLVGPNATQQIDCPVYFIMAYSFGYLSLLFASSLTILRILALWERTRVITTVVSGCWLANAILYIYCVATSDGHRVNGVCEDNHILHNRVSIFCTFATDLILLVLMLIGVLRWRGARESGSISSLLYKQGLAWVVVFTLAEVPPMVLIILDLNYSMDLIFVVPGIITMSIGATRIYLGLINGATFDNHPVWAVDVDTGAIKTPIGFPAPSQQSSLTDDAARLLYRNEAEQKLNDAI
ncbi:hypothetical protein BJV74DRAFT_613649 [Russula compacta]|nr:hypothetical protein BJV74DRAFT_613649 [Russula compacta]